LATPIQEVHAVVKNNETFHKLFSGYLACIVFVCGTFCVRIGGGNRTPHLMIEDEVIELGRAGMIDIKNGDTRAL
jgi:hypothetical protein